ncbi:hypothetical protein BIV57_04760 [Mangrovactinospora gilvigrisea]|uniref:ATP-binding protein n=1 Tax=Mangrovactinospora gilvigrisea TaxID=1428644 RepID=A0A1J7CFY2_9ACTN|nr:lipase chaperone [Mangrovactinospora gilvigrisea]OIV38570.1 hypothetical protein BIV57_04760 [Mangrovactinospora gilvigrisea]
MRLRTHRTGSAALVVAGAAALVAGAAASAQAAPRPAVPPHTAPEQQGSGSSQALSGLTSATSGLAQGLQGIGAVKLNPLNGTGTDPLTNGVGTKVADFRPVSTTDLTAPLSALKLGDLM